MSQSPFGRVLSERELDHRRRMLAHLTSISGTRDVDLPPSFHPPAMASQRPERPVVRGRILPFSPRTKA